MTQNKLTLPFLPLSSDNLMAAVEKMLPHGSSDIAAMAMPSKFAPASPLTLTELETKKEEREWVRCSGGIFGSKI